jgi:hypothetical protein
MTTTELTVRRRRGIMRPDRSHDFEGVSEDASEVVGGPDSKPAGVAISRLTPTERKGRSAP